MSKLTRSEKVRIIIDNLEDHLTIPTYLEEWVKMDIEKALRVIEWKEQEEDKNNCPNGDSF